ncbi:centrosomal protein of 104 kDa-like [Oryzias melastigma]|uniref:centrosomal protein of 104 kDa-like n=1 Tax=Oryzias melastigma TaxID=30732 RepID=UPI00168D3DBF|nr:centrosomal protein of 104 kDa-like [Oryzias melastigma]
MFFFSWSSIRGMQKKIKFSVISSSSHEDHFSAKELLVHAPTVRGWRSSRLSSFPQHVTIQLEQRSRIRKLQLLAHQFLIPTKVEFHVGDILPYSGSSELQLRRLGYVSMSDNERTGFRPRELKSVHVDAVGTFLKISLYRNHANRFNHCSQLGQCYDAQPSHKNPHGQPKDKLQCMMGMQVDVSVADQQVVPLSQCCCVFLSVRLSWFLWLPSMFWVRLWMAPSAGGVCEPMSPLDDLAFDMYQDPEVAYIIQILDQKKQDVVHQEDFEQAKMLKQAIADLQQVGERLARYDMEKRCAIEKEDYDLAKKKKEVMMELRRNIYQQLEVHGLLDMSTVQQDEHRCGNARPPPPLRSPGHHGAPEPDVSADAFRNEAGDDEEKEPSDDRHRPADAPPSTAGAPRTDVLNEERPLPTLQRKDWAAENLQSSGPHAERTPASSGRSVQLLSERALREAGPAADIYGESPVAEAFSRTWYQREQALLAVHNKLLEATSTSSKEELRNMIRAAGLLTRRALLDKVTLVFYASLKLLRLILIYIIPDVGLGRAEAAHCLQQTFPHLLQRTGDAAGRPRAAAIAFIQVMFPHCFHSNMVSRVFKCIKPLKFSRKQ